jgi:hypothetical protein
MVAAARVMNPSSIALPFNEKIRKATRIMTRICPFGIILSYLEVLPLRLSLAGVPAGHSGFSCLSGCLAAHWYQAV